MIEKDNLTKYLLFLEDVFPYMEKYQYKKGMKEIILEMKQLLKDNENSAVTDCFIPDSIPQINNYAALLTEL